MVAADVDPGFSFDRGIFSNLDSSLANYDRTRSTALYGPHLYRPYAQNFRFGVPTRADDECRR